MPAVGTVLDNPNGNTPLDRYTGEPSIDDRDITIYRTGYNLEHQFSENWRIRNAFDAVFYRANSLNISVSFSTLVDLLGNYGKVLLFNLVLIISFKFLRINPCLKISCLEWVRFYLFLGSCDRHVCPWHLAETIHYFDNYTVFDFLIGINNYQRIRLRLD